MPQVVISTAQPNNSSNKSEVCNLLEFKLDCSPSTKISFIVDRIVDRHGASAIIFEVDSSKFVFDTHTHTLPRRVH